MIRVAVNWDRLPCLREHLVDGLVHRLIECRHRLRTDLAGLQVRYERGADGRAVRVDDRDACAEHRGMSGSRREDGQSRSEEEKLHAVLRVPLDDLRQDAEWRVIHDDAAGLVLLLLVVTARIERPDEVLPAEPILSGRPVGDGLVDLLRRVAIVSRVLCFELVQELLVLVFAFFSFSGVTRVEPLIQPAEIKAEVAHVDPLDLIQVALQELRDPARVHGQLIMRQGVSPALLCGQVVEADHFRLLVAELPQRLIAPMPFHDQIVLAPDRDRVAVFKLLYAFLYLLDLFRRMRLRVLRIRRQLVEPELDNHHAFVPPIFRGSSGGARRTRRRR